MKKFIFLIAFLVSGIICFAQDYGVIYTFPATTSKAQFHIAKKNFMYVTSTKGYYAILKDIQPGTLVSTLIADLTWVYPVGATVAATASITTLAATTATITTGTLTTAVLGGKNLTTKNTNGGTYAGSLTLASGDTLFLGTQALWGNNPNGIQANNSLTATDTIFGAVAKTTIVNLVTAAASDTATKTAGKIIFLAGYFWGCNGTYYYKLDSQH